MFNAETIKQLEQDNKRLSALLDDANGERLFIRDKCASDMRIKDSESQMRINAAIRDKEVENYQLKEENAVLLKEVEILREAFKNMGSDVKSMNNKFDKLVDAVVSKSEIKVINNRK